MTTLQKLVPAFALLLLASSAKADTFLVTESGVFGAGAPTTAESAPGATFSYSFLINSTPAINFVTNFGGPDCGFDVQFSDFTYTLNGSAVALFDPDVEFYDTMVGGGVDITPNSGNDTDNFSILTPDLAQFYTGTFENPTITPGIYLIDPTQSAFETDYMGTNATPLSGNLSITETPEPNSIILVGSGLAGIGSLLRRKRAALKSRSSHP